MSDRPASGGRARRGGGRRRVRARVDGTVQGVGFRPFVHRLAGELELGGHVLNDERGVLLEVEGDDAAVERFLERLTLDAPPLATIEAVALDEVEPAGERFFRIVASERGGAATAPVAPDAATCADCLSELFDPSDRRHRYPFINCTNCGPRFTIVRGVPYDRPLTTMAGFEMCAACRREYEDPGDRRFHAEPNACPDCGPAARLTGAGGEDGVGDAIEGAVAALLDGEILAVKGLGGFHLACRADDEAAVAALRSRKHREDKPFALMCPDLDAASALGVLGREDEALLLGRERPIVLAPRRPGTSIADSVAPRSADLGLMLPYAPLHHLLLAGCGTTLVMTSGNVSDEPIAYTDEDAVERLGAIADRFLIHDRPIHMRTDDSVVRAIGGGPPLVFRRSRGYVPASLPLPGGDRPLLACGAELKSTFCVAKGGRAWVGHHIGDLKNYETLRSFSEGVDHFQRLFAVAPEIVAHDLHPDYLSTSYALARDDASAVAVQHHHAHLAAVLAEHGHPGRAVGAIFDGTGHGTDGAAWGGEVLVGGAAAFDRAGHLWPVRLPGGDRAVAEPWRMACAWLVAAGGDVAAPPAALAAEVSERDWRAVAELARTGFAAPVTTSAGRLFDAVAALCGVRARVSYEGQAAVELEALASVGEGGSYPLPVARVGPSTADAYGIAAGTRVLDARELITAIERDVAGGVPIPVVADRFHNSLAWATAEACVAAAEAAAIDTAVLAGGVFQNRLLLERTRDALTGAGLRVLVPERLPPNDGAISYGQAAVAAAS